MSGFEYLPPWCIEFNKQVFVLGELLIEGVISENEDALINFDRWGDILDGADDHRKE